MQYNTNSGCTLGSICQSNLQVLQRKLQRRPGPDTNTRNTPTGHMQRPVLGAHCNLRSTKSSLSISEHLRCDVSLTLLTSWRGKPLHEGSSRSVHVAHTHTHTHTYTHTHTHTLLQGKMGTTQVPNARILVSWIVKQDKACPTPLDAFLQYRERAGTSCSCSRGRLASGSAPSQRPAQDKHSSEPPVPQSDQWVSQDFPPCPCTTLSVTEVHTHTHTHIHTHTHTHTHKHRHTSHTV